MQYVINPSTTLTIETPPWAPIDVTVKTTRDWMAAHPSATTQEKLAWFNEMVRNDKDGHFPTDLTWDFKQAATQFQDYGNFNYGVVGTILGIDPMSLRAAAGFAQLSAHTSASDWVTEHIPSILTGNLGDAPEDQVMIKAGIEYAQRYYSPPGPTIGIQELWDFKNNPAKGTLASVVSSEVLAQYWAGKPNENPNETQRLKDYASKYWFEIRGQTPDEGVLNTPVTTQTGNVRTDSIGHLIPRQVSSPRLSSSAH